jgi:hypothetical protein
MPPVVKAPYLLHVPIETSVLPITWPPSSWHTRNLRSSICELAVKAIKVITADQDISIASAQSFRVMAASIYFHPVVKAQGLTRPGPRSLVFRVFVHHVLAGDNDAPTPALLGLVVAILSLNVRLFLRRSEAVVIGFSKRFRDLAEQRPFLIF